MRGSCQQVKEVIGAFAPVHIVPADVLCLIKDKRQPLVAEGAADLVQHDEVEYIDLAGFLGDRHLRHSLGGNAGAPSQGLEGRRILAESGKPTQGLTIFFVIGVAE